jgi:hypothetical protein
MAAEALLSAAKKSRTFERSSEHYRINAVMRERDSIIDSGRALAYKAIAL